VLKKSAGSELTAAIRSVHRAASSRPDVAREAMRDRESAADGSRMEDPYDTLTDREKQVLKLVAEGHSNKEVATSWHQRQDAMSHREHIMEKLDLHSRTELIRFAIRQGIIRVDS